MPSLGVQCPGGRLLWRVEIVTAETLGEGNISTGATSSDDPKAAQVLARARLGGTEAFNCRAPPEGSLGVPASARGGGSGGLGPPSWRPTLADFTLGVPLVPRQNATADLSHAAIIHRLPTLPAKLTWPARARPDTVLGCVAAKFHSALPSALIAVACRTRRLGLRRRQSQIWRLRDAGRCVLRLAEPQSRGGPLSPAMLGYWASQRAVSRHNAPQRSG